MGAEGVKWVSNNPSSFLTRYHGAPTANTLYSPATQAAAIIYFNTHAPWGLIGRVSLRPDGSVASRCNVNTTSLQTGDNCYSDTDQTGGEQKMVYVPQFCYYCDTLTADQVWWWIGQVSDTFRLSDDSGDYTFSSADIHPAFLVDGVAKAGAFIGVYEGYNSSSVLQSVAGVAPSVGTKANLRTYAEAIGLGWELMTVQMWGALQLLITIEYASFYPNYQVGYGVGSGSLINTGYTGIGGTVSSGNASYGVAGAISTTTPVSYRGVEDIYSNNWQLLEGIRTDTAGCIWTAPQSCARTYTDSSTLTPTGTANVGSAVGPYTNIGYAVSTLNTWATGIFTASALNWIILPNAASGGSGTTYLCNVVTYANLTSSTVFGVGGQHLLGAHNGMYNVQNQTVGTTTMGSRIQYLPS